jgi:muramoyltetrapeptide carboxypeptidase
MSHTRRRFIELASVTAAAAASPRLLAQARPPAAAPVVKPPRLKPGDCVGLIEPATSTFESAKIQIAVEVIEALGLKAKRAPHIGDRYGYLAGKDKDRAADVNMMFGDPTVNAVVAVRGGWGCARLLPYLDFNVIARNPKILVGYSDLTAMLLPVFAKTGLVTFHAPMGESTWTAFNVGYLKRVLFDGEAVTFENLKETKDSLVQVENRIRTITPGVARGRVLGGNLSVLTGIIGSGYLPDWSGAILFIEDVDENIYRVDRMLTQMRLAGILDKLRGVVIGNCTRCEPGQGGYGSLTLEEVFDDHIAPLKVPAWSGAMIGHIDRQFTIPEGVEVEIDSVKGAITMLESAVR